MNLRVNGSLTCSVSNFSLLCLCEVFFLFLGFGYLLGGSGVICLGFLLLLIYLGFLGLTEVIKTYLHRLHQKFSSIIKGRGIIQALLRGLFHYANLVPDLSPSILI